MKRTLTLLLVMAMMIAIFPSALAEEPTVLTVTIPDSTRVLDYKDNTMTAYIEKTLNVNLQFNVLAATDFATKINVSFNSGEEMSDMIIFETGKLSDALVFSWAKAGYLLPMTEMYADPELAKNMNIAYERVGYDFRGMITMPDGQIYYIPAINQSFSNEYPAKCWYYQPWLEAVGMDVPETIDELRDVLRTVVATDLNGNGVADEIGMAGWNGINGEWFSYLMNSFIYYDYKNNYMKVEDGKVSFSFMDDAFRAGVEYIGNMISEGLIAPESVTQDEATWKTMINSDPMTAFAFFKTSPSAIIDVDTKSQEVILGALEGPEGVKFSQFNPSAPAACFVIPATCSNPEKAFQVGDLLISEELSIVTRWGEHGVDWDYVADLEDPSQYKTDYEVCGYAPYILAYDDTYVWSAGTMINRFWGQVGPFIRQYAIANGYANNVNVQTSPFDAHASEGIILYQTAGYAPEETIAKLIFSEEENAVIEAYSTDIITCVKETISAWLLNPETLTDESWATFKSTISDMHADEWLEVVQAAYERTL